MPTDPRRASPSTGRRALPRTLALAAGLAALPLAALGEPAGTRPSDPCGFFRAQAFGRSIDHFATEMLWACEAIAARRAAAFGLGPRLSEAEAAFERYRAAIVATGLAAFARDRDAALRGASEATKARLAEETGTLAALEAIRTGF